MPANPNSLREIGQELITTFDIVGLANVLEERLPALGIPSCYLALYEEGEPAHSYLETGHGVHRWSSLFAGAGRKPLFNPQPGA